MNKQSSLDFELLIPLLIGGLSVVGIGVVLLVGYARNTPAQVTATPSATPFKYVYLGTEPAITTLVVEGSETVPAGDTETPAPFPSPTRPSPPLILPSRTVGAPRTNTPGGLPVSTRTSTATRAATVTRTITPGAANTYDDTDSRLQYSGSWTVQTGLPTTGSGAAYNGTLHISTDAAAKNSAIVQFSGQEFYFYYQPASSFGAVTICLDNDPLDCETVSEAQGGVWHHVFDVSSTHFVKIEHISGGSVNIDKFVIPGATPTPTRTPTP